MDPRKFGYQKLFLFFYVGMDSHMTWEYWRLGGGCIWAKMDTTLDASLSRSFGGRTVFHWKL